MSYRDEIKENIELFDVINKEQFNKEAEYVSTRCGKILKKLGSTPNTKIDIEEILKKCEKISQNGKLNIIINDEDEIDMGDLVPIEEIALRTLVRKSSPKNNRILIFLDNKKITLKLKNLHATDGKPEILEVEFGKIVETKKENNRQK